MPSAPSSLWRSCQNLPAPATLRTWNVRSICPPGGGPKGPERRELIDLGDGTFIIEERRGCFRARYRRCHTKCLAPDTLVATPSGAVRIADLLKGMLVWTQDAKGNKVAERVLETAASAVNGPHDVALVRLQDGRQIISSLAHPLLGGRQVAELTRGEIYDASKITVFELRAYDRSHTYDILPAGDTGVYWANGIPVSSTLLK